MKDPRTDSKIDLESKFKIKSEKKKREKYSWTQLDQ